MYRETARKGVDSQTSEQKRIAKREIEKVESGGDNRSEEEYKEKERERRNDRGVR